MSSPSFDVNGLMDWLNGRFGLHIPLLPLRGLPQFMKTLWRMLVPGPPPDDDDGPPWCIPVEGDLKGLLPENSTLEVKVHILVDTKTCGSPDWPS